MLCCRTESYEQKSLLCEPLEPGGLFTVRKSQEAAVGELVRMLRKAAPLCQDFSNAASLSQVSNPETWSDSIQEPKQTPEGPAPIQHVSSSSAMSSGLNMPRTTANALEELQGYREMKNLLLKQGTNSHI